MRDDIILPRPHVNFHEQIKPFVDEKVSVTVILPHYNTPYFMEHSIEQVRAQSVPCYVMVIDTGSPWAVVEELEEYRDHDVSINYIREHFWMHTSAPVSSALDAGMAMCKTEYAFFTHTDVFFKHKDVVKKLLKKCSAKHPVVGLRMSPRPPIDLPNMGNIKQNEHSKDTPGHTMLMLHMPTMRKFGIMWSMARYVENYNKNVWHYEYGWPDTESGFGRHLAECGIKPIFIGDESNKLSFDTEDIFHIRTYTGRLIYEGGFRDAKAAKIANDVIPEYTAWWRKDLDKKTSDMIDSLPNGSLVVPMKRQVQHGPRLSKRPVRGNAFDRKKQKVVDCWNCGQCDAFFWTETEASACDCSSVATAGKSI